MCFFCNKLRHNNVVYVQMNDTIAVLLAACTAPILTIAVVLQYMNLTRKKPQKQRALKKNGQPRKPRVGNRYRRRNVLSDRQKMQDLSEEEFAWGLRMSRAVFEQLLVHVEQYLARRRHCHKRKSRIVSPLYDRHVDPYIALAFTLRWLAGGHRFDLMYMFGVARTTLHVWTWRIIRALLFVLKDNIAFPTDESSLDSLAQGFANIAGGLGAAIPNTVCAFDGVVVQKCPPPQTPLENNSAVSSNTAAHFYRKGYFGAAMLAFVDAKCRFLSVSMACAASCHDTTMFECSEAGRLLERGLVSKKYNAIADDAFVTRGHILTPYVGHSLTPQEDAFNYYLSMQRQVVERAFGIWKRKWGIFWRTLAVSENHVKMVMEVTCRLHNFCIDRNVSADIGDYLVHDSTFWKAVKPAPLKHHRLRHSEPHPSTWEPVLLDTSERAHFLPSAFTIAPQERTKRKGYCDALASQGLLRPPPPTLPHSKPLPRMSANLPIAVPSGNTYS